MKYMVVVLLLIAIAVAALFIIDKSVPMLIVAIVSIIAGYFLAVFTISKEEK
ncbi:MAG: hypothetical protein L3J42_01960 [Hydrogenimonas sp.]|nr:hypothetical protein [Hydrogenimonas sp.]